MDIHLYIVLIYISLYCDVLVHRLKRQLRFTTTVVVIYYIYYYHADTYLAKTPPQKSAPYGNHLIGNMNIRITHNKLYENCQYRKVSCDAIVWQAVLCSCVYQHSHSQMSYTSALSHQLRLLKMRFDNTMQANYVRYGNHC